MQLANQPTIKVVALCQKIKMFVAFGVGEGLSEKMFLVFTVVWAVYETRVTPPLVS
jgi:hypothetical protein